MQSKESQDIKKRSICIIEDSLYFYHTNLRVKSTDSYKVLNFDNEYEY